MRLKSGRTIQATGAWIGYGQAAKADFEVRSLTDGERIELGDVVLEVMETPGHTPESIIVLVYVHAGDSAPYGVLTGDALFIVASGSVKVVLPSDEGAEPAIVAVLGAGEFRGGLAFVREYRLLGEES